MTRSKQTSAIGSPKTATRTHLSKPSVMPETREHTFVPRSYQLEGIKFAITRPAAGLFLKPGFGKTMVMLQAFRILREKGYVKRALVVGTRRIIRKVWQDEIRKWNVPVKYAAAHGAHKDAVLDDLSVELVGVTYAGLEWLKRAGKRRRKFDMLILDESSKVKNWSSLRSKLMRKMLNEFSRRYILTGSPTPLGMIDLFSQIFMLDGGQALGRFITQYRNEFFYPSGYMGFDYKIQPGAEKKIYKRLDNLVLRVDPKSLKLPPLTIVPIEVEMEDEARAVYDKLEDEFFLAFDEGKVTALNAGIKTQKLRQVANGAIYLDKQNGRYKVIHDEKIDALEDLVDELNGEPIMVAVEFLHDVDRIRKRMGKNIPYIGGGTSDKAAEKYQDDFNKGEIPLLLGAPDSVAFGLNLQEYACNVGFFAQDWSLENYEQFIQRIHRQGQKRAVICYRITTRNTIDDAIVEALKRRDRNQQQLLRALEAQHRRRQKAAA